MFWKKKKKSNEDVGGHLFQYESSCRRKNVRVFTQSGRPVYLKISDQTAPMVNISAGGLACRCTNAPPGEIVPVELQFPESEQKIRARAEVLSVDNQGICHCKFIDLPPEATDAIHLFVLGVQKAELRRKKSERPVPSEGEAED